MKNKSLTLIAAVLFLGISNSFSYATEVAKPATKATTTENTNCVKKDKKGKCPALPQGTKPTPKKKK